MTAAAIYMFVWLHLTTANKSNKTNYALKHFEPNWTKSYNLVVFECFSGAAIAGKRVQEEKLNCIVWCISLGQNQLRLQSLKKRLKLVYSSLITKLSLHTCKTNTESIGFMSWSCLGFFLGTVGNYLAIERVKISNSCSMYFGDMYP